MADEKISGIEGTVEICAHEGVLAQLLEVCSWEITQECKELDATSTDSDGYDEFMAANSNATVDVKARWYTGEAKIVGAPPLLALKQDVDFKLYVDKANYPNIFWSGSGFIKSGPKLGIDYGRGDTLTYDFTIRVSGELTPPASH